MKLLARTMLQAVVFAALLGFQGVAGSVIGIDFGTEFMKVALVQLGVPLEIVTNTISKRKTEIVIAFDRGERLFGTDAYGMLSRRPKQAFNKFGQMLGRSLEHPTLSALTRSYPGTYPVMNETRGGLSFTLAGPGMEEPQHFSVEELTAMMFTYAKDITKAYGGKEIRDCVVTVPSFATQHERRAIKAAAEIASMNVLSLIEENTAAALQYGKDNVFEDKTVLYYNMGASSTQVSVVKYGSFVGKDMGKNKTIGVFEVVGKGWDEQLGGSEFDLRIAEFLADKFNEQWSEGNIRDFPRAMAKIKQQAIKTKHILSANSEIPVKINSLHDDRDLSTHITRDEFELRSSDLFDRLTKPIETALAAANVTLTDVDAVELLGGAQRIPKVLSTLSEFFGKDRHLGVHLNADEAMALGAAFQAANLSTAFKVRKTGMIDYSPYVVQVALNTSPDDGSDAGGFLHGLLGGEKKEDREARLQEALAWEKSATIFKERSFLDSKKVIAFVHDHDISCKLSYGESPLLPAATPQLLASYNISGVREFAVKNADKCVGDKPKVQLHFKLESSGIVVLSKAEVSCEEKIAVPEADIASPETKADAPEAEAEVAGQDEAESKNESAVNSTNSSTNSSKASPKAKKTKKKPMLKAELKVHENIIPQIQAWAQSEIKDSMAKLAHLQQLDDLRKAKEAAKNGLESFVYEVRNRMYDDEEVVNKVTTEEEREKLFALLSETADWLDDEGYDTDTDTYLGKKLDIATSSDPVFYRATELEERPRAVAAAKKRLKDIGDLMEKWKTSMPQVNETEREDVLRLVASAEEWIDEKVAEQDASVLWETPKFTSSSVKTQLQGVASMVTKLSRKPKPPKAKSATKAANATNSTTGKGNSTETEGESEATDKGTLDSEDPVASGEAESSDTAPNDEL